MRLAGLHSLRGHLGSPPQNVSVSPYNLVMKFFYTPSSCGCYSTRHLKCKYSILPGMRKNFSDLALFPCRTEPDPAECRLAVIRLHSEGWSITSIAEYLVTSRHTIYDTLQRWTEVTPLYSVAVARFPSLTCLWPVVGRYCLPGAGCWLFCQAARGG